MKPAQQRKGVAEKKPTDLPLSASSTAAAPEARQRKPEGGPPTPAIWSRYIDSRMKQFGTR